jgi:cytidylate kinase
LNGKDVEDSLRTAEIDLAASKVSGVVEVRHAVNDKMKEAVKGMPIVCEGRDMTTVVFPDAECKVYLDAPIDVQVQRRYDQYAAEGKFVDYEELKQQIATRDAADKNKAEGSLKIAEDALYIDTANMNVDQVCEKITEYLAKCDKNR